MHRWKQISTGSSICFRMLQSKRRQRDQRILQHLALVCPIASHYAIRSGQDRDDLIQVGRMGLINASVRYKPAKKQSFIWFARSHIRGAILHYLRDRIGLVRLPRGIEERGLKLSREPQIDGAEDSYILQLYSAKTNWVSLDNESDSSAAVSWGAKSNNESMLDRAAQSENVQKVRQALLDLPENERIAVQKVVIGGESLRTTGRSLGVSGMTIQRRVKRGLRQLAESLKGTQALI